MKEVCDELHAYRRGVRIYCHICGNILPIVEDLVRTGLDCIAPLDPLGGLTCAQVRAIVGDSMPLMGGINTLSFLDEETDAIRTEARRCIREAGRRGAFILGSGCVVPRAAKRANILAVMDEVRVIGSDICRESDTPS
jgi:uroporphyrinogen-III decarboxylase